MTKEQARIEAERIVELYIDGDLCISRRRLIEEIADALVTATSVRKKQGRPKGSRTIKGLTTQELKLIGKPVAPSEEFRAAFPRSKVTRGTILGPANHPHEGCWRIKWDEFRLPQRLDRTFFRVLTSGEGKA